MSKSNLLTNSSAEFPLGIPWNWSGDVSVVSGGVGTAHCFKIGPGAYLKQLTTKKVEGESLELSFDIYGLDYTNVCNTQAKTEVFYSSEMYESIVVPLAFRVPYTGYAEGAEVLYHRCVGTLPVSDPDMIDHIIVTFNNFTNAYCYLDNFELWSVIDDSITEGSENMLAPSLVSGVHTKELGVPKTDYIKSACIVPQGITLASPAGNYNSYEGGYIALAILSSGIAEDLDIVSDICEKFMLLQNSDGSWYQQYNPYPNAEGMHERVPYIDEGVIDGDLKVDSGAALVAWAMSEYDKKTTGTRYKTAVRRALGFLEQLQAHHFYKYQSNMFANLIYKGQVDYVAFAADTAECILSMKHALDAYGEDLTTLPNGTSVKEIADKAYISLCTQNYAGDGVRYHATTYPIGSDTLIPFGGVEKLSYAQSLSAWANVEWVRAGYASIDYTGIAYKVLEFINPLTMGQWGGQLFKPYYGQTGETQNEYVTNTALMVSGLIKVDKDRYAHLIKNSIHAMQWLTIDDDGRTYDFVASTGELKIALRTSSKNGYGFLALGSAHAAIAWNIAKEAGVVQ